MVRKKVILLVLCFIVILLGLFLTLIYKQQNNDRTLNDTYSEELRTYTNYRFGFEIDYPKKWPIGKQADNGDGINLYNSTDAEILVYGSNVPSSFSTQDAPVERSRFKLNDGTNATLLKFWFL
jgi:hypothetical protein